MDSLVLSKDKVNKIAIKLIAPEFLKNICQSMTISPPVGLAQDNHAYHQMKIFAACIDNKYIGIMEVECTTPTNAHIRWLYVHDSQQLHLLANKFLQTAENYCFEKGYASLTAEIISSSTDNLTNHKLYPILEKLGFKLLFTKQVQDGQCINYLQKLISLNDFIFVDLTHTLSPNVPHWGIDIAFKYNARTIESVEANSDVKFRVQRLEMSAGIGTHMDAPSHCFEDGPAINNLPIQSLITICRVIDVSPKAHDTYTVMPSDIENFENTYGMIPKKAFVILYTGWDKRWKEAEKYRNEKIFPSISLEAAQLLLDRDIVGLGIDTLSPDRFGSNFPVHALILNAGKYIVENVANAAELDPAGSYIFALPIKIKDGTEAPMRLIGMKPKHYDVSTK